MLIPHFGQFLVFSLIQIKSSPLPFSLVDSRHNFAISQSQGVCDSSKQRKQKFQPQSHLISLAKETGTLMDKLHLGFGQGLILLFLEMKFLQTTQR